MTEIPVIDVSDAFAGNKVDLAVIAIDAALREFGFFQMVGHGIDPSAYERTYEQMSTLMRQPAAYKEALRNTTGHPYYGLVRKYEPEQKRYVAEQFEINHFETQADARAAGVSAASLSHFGDNIWPDQDGFRATVRGCFEQHHALIRPLMSLMALALEQPAGYFDPYLERDSTSFAVSDYPSTGFMQPGETILAWHTDRETLVNMLHQRGSYEGLQLQPPSGELITVPIIPDALVVNVGQLIDQWTSGRWPAVRHRVMAGEDGQWRQSIVTFSAPDVDMVITPLPPQDAPQSTTTPFRVFDLAADMPRQDVYA